MGRIDLYISPASVERAPLEGRSVVVVDVLRSSTTIAWALRSGAAKVIPVESVEEATRLAHTLDAKTRLLCGEREGKKVGGFDLGNSPREYVRERVEGKTLVFASTNASPLMAKALGGYEQRLLGYVNLGAVTDALRKAGADVAIVCAGRNGRFSLEDAACAGALVRRLRGVVPGLALNDAAEMAADYDHAHGHDVEAILRRSEHGRYLIELGFEEDLPVCAAVDQVPIVPLLKDGRITLPVPVDAAARPQSASGSRGSP
jgi:2-phosphosulfolactate phosphatase